MRILIYGLNHAPEIVGVGKYTGEMVEWLIAQGCAVRVVTAPPYYPEWRIYPGYCSWRYHTEKKAASSARIYRCPLFVPQQQSGLKRLLHLASFAISSAPLVMAQSLWWRPDCVIVIAPTFLCAPIGWLAARLSGAAAWLHIQDFELDAAFEVGLMRGGLLRSIAARGERWWLRRFDRVSTISSQMLKRLLVKGVAETHCELFPNWVSTKAIYPSSDAANHLRRELNIGDDAIVALYAGNMGEKQGLEIILEVAARLSGETHLQFVLAGEGAAKSQLVAKAAGMSNVRFLPLYPLERLNELLNLGQIHLLTQRAEIADFVMPSKLTGILAVGGAVIATARPNTELAQVLEQAGGRVCPPGDASAMAEQVVALSRAPETRRAMSVKARQYALDHFARDKILADFESELRHLQADETIRNCIPWRWLLFALWTVGIFYSMDIFKPTESQIVVVIKEWFARHGLSERAPDKLYHGWSFVIWSILLAGAVARGYLTILSRRQLCICALALILFAGLPEGLQHFNSTRVPSWFDASINLGGGVVGLACQIVIAHIWQKS